MRKSLAVLLLLAVACSAQTIKTVDGRTVGSTAGDVSSALGKTIGTATGNLSALDGLKAASASLPNLGNTTAESSTNTWYLMGQIFTASASGTYVTFHVECSSTVSGTNLVAGVYPVPSSTATGQTLISSTTLSCPSSAAWVTGTISAPITSGSKYELMLSGASGTKYNMVSTGGTSEYANSPYTYTGTMPATAPLMDTTTNLVSVYLSTP